MLLMEQWINEHPYLFHILGPVILFWILWIPFGNRLIRAMEGVVKDIKSIFCK